MDAAEERLRMVVAPFGWHDGENAGEKLVAASTKNDGLMMGVEVCQVGNTN